MTPPFDFRDAIERRLSGSVPGDYGLDLDQFVGMKMTPDVLTQVARTAEAHIRRVDPDLGVIFVLTEMDTVARNINVRAWDPMYLHHCDRCRFLGRFVDETPPQREEFDLYVCDKQLTGRTFIARWGDDGPSYISGRMQGLAPPLDEAMRRFDVMGMCRP